MVCVVFILVLSQAKNILYKINEQRFQQISIDELSASESALRFWLYVFGSEKVFEKLSKDPSFMDSLKCHQLSHKIGRAAFKVDGMEALSLNNDGCNFGVLHGSVEQMVQKLGEDNLTLISQICRDLKPSIRKTNCFHGTGHGFMAITHGDLTESLELCQGLDQEGINNCSSGVFMESVMSLIENHDSHHTIASNNSDSNFPCNQVANLGVAIQRICFEYQASRVLSLAKGNFDIVIDFCNESADSVRKNCFINVGQEAVYFFYPKFEQIVDICNKVGGTQERQACIEGVIFNITSMLNTRIQNEPHQICNILMADDTEMCYQTLGENIKIIFDDIVLINMICERSESAYIETCKKFALLQSD